MSFYHVSTYIFALYNGPKQGLTGSGFLLLDGTGQVCTCKKVRLPGRVRTGTEKNFNANNNSSRMSIIDIITFTFSETVT